MSISITGASGLIGQTLSQELTKQGHEVIALKRLKKQHQSHGPEWNLKPLTTGNNVETVIHLAGENIAAKRWSKKQKQKIYDSRILGTRHLVNHILQSDDKPKTFLCASAIGYYGNRGDEFLTEASDPGDNFSATIAQNWEQECCTLKEHGIRVVNLRFGVVLSSKGGALKKMLLPFKLGLGGAMGDGKQVMSWISINDAIKAILFILDNQNITGPVNVTSPNPVANEVFTKVLAQCLNRPAFFNMPSSICQLAFGEMAEELLLSGAHVIPQKLLDHGYTFVHLDIEQALKEVLS